MKYKIAAHSDIKEFLEDHKNWTLENDTLYAEYKFTDFAQAWAFLNHVAKLQEKHNHHAEIFNLYNIVRLRFTTHDKGNVITHKDLDIIRDIERDKNSELKSVNRNG